jgi:hypothetical protein
MSQRRCRRPHQRPHQPHHAHRRRRSAAIATAVAVLLPALVIANAAVGGEADVETAEIAREAGGTYRISATVRHDDTGWDHYADAWEVVAPDGTVIARRELLHPHVEEQPFTRSLGGVEIPAGIDRVRIRARDSVHGLGGAEVVLEVPIE